MNLTHTGIGRPASLLHIQCRVGAGCSTIQGKGNFFPYLVLCCIHPNRAPQICASYRRSKGPGQDQPGQGRGVGSSLCGTVPHPFTGPVYLLIHPPSSQFAFEPPFPNLPNSPYWPPSASMNLPGAGLELVWGGLPQLLNVLYGTFAALLGLDKRLVPANECLRIVLSARISLHLLYL